MKMERNRALFKDSEDSPRDSCNSDAKSLADEYSMSLEEHPDDNNDFHSCNYEFAVTNTSTTARTYTPYFGSEGAVAQFYSSTLSSAAGVVAPAFMKIMEVGAILKIKHPLNYSGPFGPVEGV